jgi:hypothetical protein
MVPDAYVNHIPVLTGGVGREELKVFYSKHFIPKMPPDTEMVPISRTIGTDRLVDEMIGCCPVLPRQAGKWNAPWSQSSTLGKESSPTSIFTGTKHLCWFNLDFSTHPTCQLLA